MKTELISYKEKMANFSFVLPALLIFFVFYIYPFFYTFWLSLHKGDAISYLEFVGLKNFKDLLLYDKAWWRSMYNAGFITLWALTFQNILAFLLALGVDKAIKTAKFYRVIFFILPILSEIIIGLLLREILLSEPGILNHYLEKMGLGFLTRDWLGPESALLSCALAHCWKGFGWAFVIFLAGLQTIPRELYEAACVDGASAKQTFFRITLPLMLPVLVLVLILTILGTMQAFAMILALTRGTGGITEVPVMRIYNHLRYGQTGLACSEGVILGLILVSVSFGMLKLSRMIRRRYALL